MKKKLQTWYSVEFVISREGTKELTFAIVTADINNENLRDEMNFLEAVQRAVTRWVKGSDNGKKAWKLTCEDFNIGDMDNWTSDTNLKKCLCEEGIDLFNIRIISHSSICKNWMYDTVLSGE